MKISILVEKKNEFIKIPISDNEVDALYDLGFRLAVRDEYDEVLEKELRDFFVDKIWHLRHDILDDGTTYSSKFKNGNFKFKKNKHKTWLIKKPKWRRKHG